MLDSSPREPVRGLPSLSRTSEPHFSVPFPLGTQAGDKRPREIIRWSTLIHTHARFGGRGCICLFSNVKYPLLCQFSGKKTGIWLILYYRLNFRIPDFQKNEHGKLSRTHRSFLQFFEKKKKMKLELTSPYFMQDSTTQQLPGVQKEKIITLYI